MINANTILNGWINKAANQLQNQYFTLAGVTLYGTANNQTKNLQTQRNDYNSYIICDSYVCSQDDAYNKEICK